MSAVRVSRACYDKYRPIAVLPAVLRDDIDALAGHFHGRGEFRTVFLSLVPWNDLVGEPNAGHATVADFLICGAAMLLMDGVTRSMYRDPSGGPRPLLPGRVERLTISLGEIHHTLRAGHRVEIDVTSSNFPRRARNTNSGHPVLASDGEADIRVATNTIHHAEATPSFLELPVLIRR
jgi:predicted acyl esterase